MDNKTSRIASKPAVSALIEVAKDEGETPTIRQEAVRTLADIGPAAEDAIPVLRAIMKKGSIPADFLEEIEKALKSIEPSPKRME